MPTRLAAAALPVHAIYPGAHDLHSVCEGERSRPIASSILELACVHVPVGHELRAVAVGLAIYKFPQAHHPSRHAERPLAIWQAVDDLTLVTRATWVAEYSRRHVCFQVSCEQ